MNHRSAPTRSIVQMSLRLSPTRQTAAPTYASLPPAVPLGPTVGVRRGRFRYAAGKLPDRLPLRTAHPRNALGPYELPYPGRVNLRELYRQLFHSETAFTAIVGALELTDDSEEAGWDIPRLGCLPHPRRGVFPSAPD